MCRGTGHLSYRHKKKHNVDDNTVNSIIQTFKWKSKFRCKTKHNHKIDSLPRWATLHPSNWTSVELTLWLEYVAKEYKMDVETTYNLVDSFQDLDGRRLLQMSQDDFRGINEQHGEFLYDIFRQMCIVGKIAYFVVVVVVLIYM